MLPKGGTIKCFAAILNVDKSLEANLENKHGGPCRGRLFWRKIVPLLGIRISTDRREEKRNFLIQGRRFRRSFKNYCNYRYFMKLSRLLSIVKLGIDVLLLEHLQSRCIDSSMYRYTPNSRATIVCIIYFIYIIKTQPKRKCKSLLFFYFQKNIFLRKN